MCGRRDVYRGLRQRLQSEARDTHASRGEHGTLQVFVARRECGAVRVAAEMQPSRNPRGDDRSVVVDTQDAVERMRRSEVPRLVGGAGGVGQVQCDEIRWLGALERARSLGGDGELRADRAGGLDECGGAVGGGGEEKKEASQATSSRPRSRGSRPSRDR